ncbi:MAG TPA: hypothetical protein VK790_02380 [Solirubrobacteraceae bacterium]|jgi:hypothetical protein|nr:hypothetical protein [Solirubrobacteraceae bacterium]
MGNERSRVGLVVAAVGAIVLAVSVFLPWYGVSFTESGIAAAQQASQQVISEFGNAKLQASASGLDSSLAGLAGQQVGALTAHQAFKYMSILLLVIAGLALLDVLPPLARSGPSTPGGAGGSAALLGTVAAAFVLFRMVERPETFERAVSLSLREGAWLALAGSVAIVVGGMWPRVGGAPAGPDATTHEDVWSSLSGWTPGT